MDGRRASDAEMALGRVGLSRLAMSCSNRQLGSRLSLVFLVSFQYQTSSFLQRRPFAQAGIVTAENSRV